VRALVGRLHAATHEAAGGVPQREARIDETQVGAELLPHVRGRGKLSARSTSRSESMRTAIACASMVNRLTFHSSKHMVSPGGAPSE
jgi:hypothetical protein